MSSTDERFKALIDELQDYKEGQFYNAVKNRLEESTRSYLHDLNLSVIRMESTGLRKVLKTLTR